MEILSDATFKGNLNVLGTSHFSKNVDFSSSVNIIGFLCGSEFTSTGPITGFSYHISDHLSKEHRWAEYGQERDCSTNYGIIYSGASEFHFHTNTFGAKVELKNACLGGGFNSIGLTSSDGNHYNQVFQNKGGMIALVSDLPHLSDYQKKFTTFSSPSIPANCTAFEFTGTAISDTNKTHIIQVQNTSTGRSVIAETWMTTNKKPAMSFAGCTSIVDAGTYTAIVL